MSAEDDELDNQDFYEAMQTYRWAGLLKGGKEEDVALAFEAVKAWIRQPVQFVVQSICQKQANIERID